MTDMAPDLRVCPTCGEENPARAKFCMECGNPFPIDIVDTLPQEATGGERRVVSVLFADLSGFTSFSEQTDVEDVRAIARETADRLGEIVVRYGGTVDKIIGDCVMAVWGAPSSHEDDPERSVRAALDMQAHIRDNAERFAGLGLSIGINTGEAIWAPVGGQYTVLGDTVNTAARLQGAADKGEILVGSDTYGSTNESVEYETLLPIAMKNKRDPVPAFKALSVQGEVRRRRTTSLPLVGREGERERLWEIWELVRTESHPYGAVVLGAAGIGKSRLIRAVVDDIGSEASVFRGACLPYGEGITYWPLIEMIKQASGVLHDDDNDAVSLKLGAFLEGLGSDDLDELRTMAVALANLVGAPTTPRGTYSATEISKGELHWGLRRIFDLSSRLRPVVLLIEDLHWAEPALLELMQQIIEPRTGAPLLVLNSARPEFAEKAADFLAPRPNQRVLSLDALGEDASLEMIRRLVGGEGEVPESTLRQLLDSAGGNPLFLEEMIQTWVDAGATGEALAQMEVPKGLRGLIASRLDRLPAREKRILGHAAVIGDVFWSGALATLEGKDEGIDGVLRALEQRDLVHFHETTTVTGQREFGFKHGLIREVAYTRLPKSERAVMHERCGNWIAGIDENEFAEIIAYHLEEACKLAGEVARSARAAPVLAAVRALQRAAEKSEGREGIREAAGFYGRALDLVGARYPETAADLRLRRARLEAQMGQALERAFGDLADVARTATETGRADLRARALVNLAGLSMVLGRPEEAKQHLGEAEEAAVEAKEPVHLIRVAFVKADLSASVDGSLDAAEHAVRGAAELADEIGDTDLQIGCQWRLGTLAYYMGKLDTAASAFRRGTELSRQRGSLRDEATMTGLLAEVVYHLGPREEAEELALRASQWLERLNDRHQHGIALRLLGKIALGRDDPAEAQRRFTNSLELIAAAPLYAASLQRWLAEARGRQGRAIGARAAASGAAEAAPEGDSFAMALAATADGCAAAAEREPDALREAFGRALGLFEQQNLTTDLAETRLSYARALTHIGDAAGAKEQLVAARHVFEATGALASAREADDLLRKAAEGADLFGPLGDS